MLAVAAFCALVFLPPTPALAKSYVMEPVVIDATLAEDGTLTVTEKRSFRFEGEFTCVWWKFDTYGTDGYTVTGIELTREDGTTTALTEVPFVESWRDEGGPGRDAFSVDQTGQRVAPYVFFEAEDETLTVTLHYVVANAVETYTDVAEIYWQFIGYDWDEASNQVSLTLTLPAPASFTKESGDIRAWGRGPLDGETRIEENGSVVFTIPRLSGGSWAEAQVLFPVSWVSGMPIEHDREHLQERLDEMKAWEEERDTINSLLPMRVLDLTPAALLPLVVLAAAYVLYLAKGREYKPKFREKYWRDRPSDDHPVVVGALHNWGAIFSRDLTATLMHLTNLKVISIDKGWVTDRVTGERKEDYYLSVDRDAWARLTNPIDTKALTLVFDTLGYGEDPLSFSTIEKRAYGEPGAFKSALDDWADAVKEVVASQGFFEKSGNVLKPVYLVVAFLVMASIFLNRDANIPALFSSIFCGMAISVLGFKMQRRNPAAAELNARCEALRNWLRDFSNLHEAIPTDVKVWDHFLVYAVVFDVADKVVEQLSLSVPQVYEDPAFRSSYLWSSPEASSSGQGVAALSVLTTGFSAAVTKATEADRSSGGDSSSSGGGGGGFVGGGGGGFGGGGGGAR
jgi:uncharacterized membrane protein